MEPANNDSMLNKKREEPTTPVEIIDQNQKSKSKKAKKKIIHFCSSNKNKFEELSRIFSQELPEVEIKQVDVELPELQGSGLPPRSGQQDQVHRFRRELGKG